MAARINRRLMAARVLDRAGGKMSAARFRDAMGEHWTVNLRDNLTSGGFIEPADGGVAHAPADYVLTAAGREYARSEPPVAGWKHGQRAQRAERPAPAVVGEVPEHVRPLVARRAALEREIKQLDAALAALGVV